MKIKTFHIRLSKDYINSDEEKLKNFLNDIEVINTFSELVKTEKVNYLVNSNCIRRTDN